MLSQLGPYLIDEELAEGGMARVFRARLRGLGGFEKQLVIKQIRPELARDPHFVELFVREANTLVALSHPHIVQVYELGAADGTYYLSMEYVEGATIASMLSEGPLSPALTAHLGAQICEALDYAHSRFGILHRDITPRNIIVDQAGHGRLLDFGIATSVSEHGRELFGSPGYMSPEQARGQALGPESDLFALGCVLFECLAGAPAFAKTLGASLTEKPDFARLADQPASLVRLVSSLLAADSSERPKAQTVSRSLREFLAQARPEGVLHEMQVRAARAAAAERERRIRNALARQENQALTVKAEVGVEQVTARIAAQSIATSPALTEIMRSSGLAPIPQPPEHTVEGTRRIRERSPAAAPELAEAMQAKAHSPALTRMMLKAWPTLAFLAMAIALGVAFRRGSKPALPAPLEQTALALATDRVTGTEKLPVALEPKPAEPLSEPARGAATHDAGVDAGSREGSARVSLSINAMPWADVTIDGKPQGTTPLRKLKLRSGVHRVELSCPPLGRTRALSIELPSKGEARMMVDLQQEPPRTFLDGAKEVR